MEPESRFPRFLTEAIVRAAQEEDSHRTPQLAPALAQAMTAAISDAAQSTPLAPGTLDDKTPVAPQANQSYDFASSPATAPGTELGRFGGFGGTPMPPWFQFQHPFPFPWAVEGPVRARKPRRRRKSQSHWPLGPDETARMPEACAIIGLSEGSIRNRYNPNSAYYDATFPPPKRLGGGGIGKSRNAIGWRAGDLYAWRDAQRSSKQ